MKKIWLMLLLISSVCAFTACSDDDNGGNGGNDGNGDNGGNTGNTGKNPITELYMSDQIEIGEPTTIPGKGFAADAKLYVENADSIRTKVENLTVDAAGVTFTLPASLPGGEYALVLEQNDGVWKLGSFKAIKMIEVKRVKNIIAYIPGEAEGDDPLMHVNYDLIYDGVNGKLKAFSNTSEIQDENGEVSTLTTAYEFTYTDNVIQIGGSAIDNEAVFPVTYNLENGKIVNSATKKVDYEIIYGEDGRPIGSEPVISDAEYTWSYEGDYLKSLTGSATIDYHFTDGNLTETNGHSFVYSEKENNFNVDIPSCVLYFNGVLENDLFFAYLLGACGKSSANLPATMSSETLGDATFDYPEGGNSVLVDMGWAVMTLSYEFETVKVRVEE